MARPQTPPLTEEQAKNRIAAQLPMAAKLEHATTVLDNSGTLADLDAQVDRAVARWKRQQGGNTGWWWRLCWLVPPVGLVAAWVSLLTTWLRSRKPRRRTRGEGGGERYEMKDMKRKPSAGSRN